MTEEAVFLKDEDSILLKKSIARMLYRKKIDQSRISELLHLSQPMVSNYCSSQTSIPVTIQILANHIVEKITDGSELHFHTCATFSDNIIEGFYHIAEKNELISEENNNIVNNLTEAFLLLKGENIAILLPEVKINIAMAKEGATSADNIASFLNGLLVVDDKVASINGIRFGTSKHLSNLLLDLRKKISVNAIMNIAYDDKLTTSMLSHQFLTKDFTLKQSKTTPDILFHKGDFGIEPCSYILGKDAVDVAKKLLQIRDELSNA
jgi:predicted fused transcriptional regulator/phosphomethylpyrimidine kinase